MFHIDLTMEDTRLALYGAGQDWQGWVHDGLTGETKHGVRFSGVELAAILALAIPADGVSLTDEMTGAFYAVAEPALEREGIATGALRLIP